MPNALETNHVRITDIDGYRFCSLQYTVGAARVNHRPLADAEMLAKNMCATD